MRKFLFFSIVLFASCVSTGETAQDPAYSGKAKLVYEDFIYDKDIHTVQLYRGQYENSFPVIFLGDPTPLTLEFDEILPVSEIESEFYVDIISCNENWKPSNVMPIEFYEGFTQQRIGNFTRSENTKIPYIHYSYSFPYEENFFKMSGNYLLKVYRNNSNNDLVLTRRFLVAGQKAAVSSIDQLNDRVERIEMERLRFTIIPSSNLQVLSPADIRIKVMQNFRWDNIVENPRPAFIKQGEYQYRIELAKDFQAGNEFRLLDIRSMRLYALGIRDITEHSDIYDVTLKNDKPRTQNTFASRADLNGSYFVDVQEWRNEDFEADYVNVRFRMESIPPIHNASVYVYGKLTDWRTNASNRMVYNSLVGRYESNMLLKQGVYDYQFVAKDSTSGKNSETPFEGRSVKAENFYTVLVYYRSPIGRNDELIGYQAFNYYDE
ncbi:DUF5103 domain-containing protein [bacterium]|nr:DUF5103 domain-containing protein [bacterium]